MQNRVQRALARRERMRRLRDQAWMVFAAFTCTALVGWWFLIEQATADRPASWWSVAIYAAIALISTMLATRAFAAAKRLTRRMAQAEPLEIASDSAEERQQSVWDEVLTWRRRR